METFIPILIAIVIFAFQAYSNFQKEQEKAKRRDLGQPPPLPPLPEDNAERPGKEYWDEPLVEPIPADRYQPPASAPQPVLPMQRGFERYSGVVDTAETLPGSSTRQRPLIPQRLAVNEEVYSQATLDASEFDLRDAVIKSAILERPYQ